MYFLKKYDKKIKLLNKIVTCTSVSWKEVK